MKNKLFLIIMFIVLLLPAPVLAEDVDVAVHDAVNIEEDGNRLLNQLDEEIMPDSSEAVAERKDVGLPYKEPISKRKLVKKFLLAMFAVGVSSLILYFGLTLYNSIREGNMPKVKTLEGETPLTAPEDLSSAVKVFLNKTKWK